jgi:hypothetical protein
MVQSVIEQLDILAVNLFICIFNLLEWRNQHISYKIFFALTYHHYNNYILHKNYHHHPEGQSANIYYNETVSKPKTNKLLNCKVDIIIKGFYHIHSSQTKDTATTIITHPCRMSWHLKILSMRCKKKVSPEYTTFRKNSSPSVNTLSKTYSFMMIRQHC